MGHAFLAKHQQQPLVRRVCEREEESLSHVIWQAGVVSFKLASEGIKVDCHTPIAAGRGCT